MPHTGAERGAATHRPCARGMVHGLSRTDIGVREDSELDQVLEEVGVEVLPVSAIAA